MAIYYDREKEIIMCYHKQLTTLPDLPETLQELHCQNNQLTILPTLPPTLHTLHCHNNLITTLPTLPPTLHTLDCAHNQLQVLPTLPQHCETYGVMVMRLRNFIHMCCELSVLIILGDYHWSTGGVSRE